jgi:HNH endonuclease
METMNPAVEYRPCPRVPADRYRFGKDGSAWHRHGSRQRPGGWKRLRPERSKGGRLRILIRSNGRRQRLGLAALVLSAFGEPRPLGMEVHYRDGDRTNCALSNLQWVPRGTYAVGRPSHRTRTALATGSAKANAVLSNEQVEQARVWRAQGHTVANIAIWLGCSSRTICAVTRGERYRDAPGPLHPAGVVREPLRGSALPQAKLDELDVVAMRRRRRLGETCAALAREYGVSVGMARRAIDGTRYWKHVRGELAVAEGLRGLGGKLRQVAEEGLGPSPG